MVLLVGIGNDMLSSFYTGMSQNVLNFEELGVKLVLCMTLLLLVNQVPPMVGGIITGSGIGSAGRIGNFGTGAAVGAVYGGGWHGSGCRKRGRFCRHGWCCKPRWRWLSNQGSVRQGINLYFERKRRAQRGRNVEQ